MALAPKPPRPKTREFFPEQNMQEILDAIRADRKADGK